MSDENAATATAAEENTGTAEAPESAEAPEGDGDLMKALRSERELHKAERKRANEAEAERDSLQEKLTDAESKLADAEKTGARALRIAVAAEAGLNPHLAPRLQGDTREELEADAREIVGAIVGSGGSLDGGARRTTPQARTPEQQHARTIGALLAGEDPNDLWEED